MYDPTVLNPINFIMISILEHALPYFPGSTRINSWLIKAYAKMGLVTNVQNVAKGMEDLDEANLQRLGAYKFSCFADFGYEKTMMTELIGNFKDFYKDKVNENKNKIVTSLLHKDFENIHSL